jgi:hypothetical protein
VVAAGNASSEDAIELPDGRTLTTLRDAATYITELPKAEHDAAEWQAAMEVLLLVAERDWSDQSSRLMSTWPAQLRHAQQQITIAGQYPGRSLPAAPRAEIIELRRAADM